MSFSLYYNKASGTVYYTATDSTLGHGFTAYSGSKGAIGGARWATSRILATSTGAANGTLIAAPSVPAADGATAFTVSAAAR